MNPKLLQPCIIVLNFKKSCHLTDQRNINLKKKTKKNNFHTVTYLSCQSKLKLSDQKS